MPDEWPPIPKVYERLFFYSAGCGVICCSSPDNRGVVNESESDCKENFPFPRMKASPGSVSK